MLTRLRHRVHGQGGFTLIELLVVILIIGILAAVAIPAFLNQKGKANDANAKSDINTAQTAEETYFTDSQVYTGTNANLTAIEPTLTSAFQTGTGPGGNGPDDPGAGHHRRRGPDGRHRLDRQPCRTSSARRRSPVSATRSCATRTAPRHG